MTQFLKKTFSAFVTFTTILSSVFVGTFAFATSAAAASAGDLIKASGPAVYYYAGDGKRYVFPNEKTYFSWYQNFSSVKTISDAELAAIMIGGNVTMRPGTKLVKITTDPKVYAVTAGGQLHWVQTEAIAVALWGANWAKSVVDVPDGFFVNYSVGAPLATAIHPDGALVSYAGSSDKFVVMSGQKRKFVSDAAFMANGLNPADVVQTSVVYPAGSDVAGRESALSDIKAGGGGVVVGGSMSVSLASDTPAGVTFPKGAASMQLSKFNFTAGASGATLSGLTVHHVGVGTTADVSNLYIYDGAGARLTSGRTINSQDHTASFNSLNVVIPAGQTVSLMVVGDFVTSGGTAGGEYAFELADAASVVISGQGSVSGSFPVRGNKFTEGSSSAGRIDVLVGATPADPKVGSKGVEISNFKLAGNTNDIEVRRITLLQAGSITNTDLSNLTLYQGTSPVATAASLMNDKIVLTFNPPYLLSNGTTKVFSLKGDVAGRSGRTIKTYVEYSTDVYAIDKVYNSGSSVCISSSGTCTTGSFDGTGSNFVTVTTLGGQLTVSFNGPTTQNVAKGSQSVKLYDFALTSAENQLEIKKIVMMLGQTNGGKVAGGTNAYFRNLRIKNLTSGATVMGPISIAVTSAATSTLTFTDAFNLPPNTTMNLSLLADLYSGTDDTNGDFAGKGFVACLNNGGTSCQTAGSIFGSTDVRIVNTGEYLATSSIIPNSAITGNTMTVKASSLDVALAGSPSSNTYVKKQAGIQTVGLVFNAGAQNDVLVTSVKLTGSATTTVGLGGSYSAALLDDVVTSCGLYDGLTPVGLAQAPASDGTMTISNMNYTVPKGLSKTLVVKCTADSVIGDATNGDKFAIGIAASTDITAQDSDANSITGTSLTATTGVTGNAGTSGQSVIQTVKSAGTLNLATNNLRQATILVAGGDVWQNFAEFKATAQYEGMTIDRVNVTSTGVAAAFSAVAIAQDGVVKGTAVLPSGIAQNKDVDLSGNPINVPKDQSITFQVWGKLANIQSSSSVSGSAIDTGSAARSGNSLKLGLAATIVTGDWDSNYATSFNVRTAGSASGDRVYTSGSSTLGNAFVARKSKPMVTKQNVSSNVLSQGADMDLYKFQVSADPGGPVAVKKMSFNISFTTNTNSTLQLSNFRIRRGASDLSTNSVRILEALGATQVDLGASGTLTGASGASSTHKIAVEFVSEETISGSGNLYTLHATVGGNVVSGDALNVSFNRTGGSTIVTGYLTNRFVTSTTGLVGPHIDTSTAPANTEGANGTFVWSDQSEVPHSDAQGGAAAGSRDWTDDVYVEDITPNIPFYRS